MPARAHPWSRLEDELQTCQDGQHGSVSLEEPNFIQKDGEPTDVIGKRNRTSDQHTQFKGVLRWIKKTTASTAVQVVESPRLLRFYVTVVHGDESLADLLAQTLFLKLIPDNLLRDSELSNFLKDSQHTLFHPESCTTLASLLQVMSRGFSGCVYFKSCLSPGAREEQTVLILMYNESEEPFLGLIPNNQLGFKQRLLRVLQHQKDIDAYDEKHGSSIGYTVTGNADEQIPDPTFSSHILKHVGETYSICSVGNREVGLPTSSASIPQNIIAQQSEVLQTNTDVDTFSAYVPGMKVKQITPCTPNPKCSKTSRNRLRRKQVSRKKRFDLLSQQYFRDAMQVDIKLPKNSNLQNVSSIPPGKSSSDSRKDDSIPPGNPASRKDNFIPFRNSDSYEDSSSPLKKLGSRKDSSSMYRNSHFGNYDSSSPLRKSSSGKDNSSPPKKSNSRKDTSRSPSKSNSRIDGSSPSRKNSSSPVRKSDSHRDSSNSSRKFDSRKLETVYISSGFDSNKDRSYSSRNVPDVKVKYNLFGLGEAVSKNKYPPYLKSDSGYKVGFFSKKNTRDYIPSSSKESDLATRKSVSSKKTYCSTATATLHSPQLRLPATSYMEMQNTPKRQPLESSYLGNKLRTSASSDVELDIHDERTPKRVPFAPSDWDCETKSPEEVDIHDQLTPKRVPLAPSDWDRASKSAAEADIHEQRTPKRHPNSHIN